MQVNWLNFIVPSLIALIGTVISIRARNRVVALQNKLDITRELSDDQRKLYLSFCEMLEKTQKDKKINESEMKEFITNAIVFASDDTVKLLKKMMIKAQKDETYTPEDLRNIGIGLLLSFRKELRFSATKLTVDDIGPLKINDWVKYFPGDNP